MKVDTATLKGIERIKNECGHPLPSPWGRGEVGTLTC